MAKDLLKNFRRDTFNEMRDTGLLRDTRQYSLIQFLLPGLQNQTNVEIHRKKEFEEGIDSVNTASMRGFARTHKEAIVKEAKRIDDKRKEEQRIQKEKEEAKRLRREA